MDARDTPPPPARRRSDWQAQSAGRYRHQDACAAFRAAAPRRIQADGETLDPRVRGESYKVGVYEDAIGLALGHVAISARLKAAVVPLATRPEHGGPDVLAQARIRRERERAALRFAKHRDLGRLEATMARTWSRCPTCGSGRRTRGATRSRRPCSSGSTCSGPGTTRSR